MCERPFAVALGVSEATFARARAHITKDRPTHAGTVPQREKLTSFARSVLDAWVSAQPNKMEGDKITGNKWYTVKTTEKQLWHRYLVCCDKAQQPCVGSYRLLHSILNSHSEISELKPTGHAICDTCSEIHSGRPSLEGDSSENAKQRSAELDVEAEGHRQFHSR